MGRGTKKRNRKNTRKAKAAGLAAGCCLLGGIVVWAGISGDTSEEIFPKTEAGLQQVSTKSESAASGQEDDQQKYSEYEFDGIKLKLPEEWEGKYEAKQKDVEVVFMHKASAEAGMQAGDPNCGTLFQLYRSESFDFADGHELFYLVGSNDEAVYYITVPGDMQGFEKDETIAREWKKLSAEVEWISENAECENPGVPMYTTEAVNLREKNGKKSKALEVLDENSRVWVLGNIAGDWAKVIAGNMKGYVNTEYLEFPEALKDAVDGAEDGSSSETADTDKKTDDSSADSETSSDGSHTNEENKEIPFQGEGSAILFDRQGGSVQIRKSVDGYWYGDDGIFSCSWDTYDEAAVSGGPIISQDGKKYYWTELPQGTDEEEGSGDTDTGNGDETEDDEIPFQGASSAMLYGDDGSEVQINQSVDGYWYGSDGLCYGSWDEIDDAIISGSSVTNENGETYYWTLQN